MIRITSTSLIIEIPSSRPLETLSDLTTGLLNLVACIDHNDAPKEYVTWGLKNLQNILQQMSLNSNQMGAINEAVKANKLLEAELK